MRVLRFVPLALCCGAPLAAQHPARHTLGGAEVALYNLAGVVQLEAASGEALTVDVAPGGADAGRLKVEEGRLGSRSTLRVVYPGDRIRYPQMDGGSTDLHVRDDGTFGDPDDRERHHPDHSGDHEGRRVRISRDGGGVEAWADLRVAVPAGRTLAVRLAVGKLAVTNVDGRLYLHALNAPVTVNGAKGELAVEVGAGDVRLSGTDGVLRVTTGSGGVQLTRARGPRLAVETGSGDVSGSDLDTAELSVETGSGDVRMTAARAPHAGLETGSGAVIVEIRGDVDRLDVETGSGDVAITAPPTLSAELELQTASGEINSDFPLLVTRSARDHLRGTVGAGKGRIVVETGSGEVRLLRAGS